MPSPRGVWLHTPYGQQLPPSPASRVLTENPLLPLQPLPVRGSACANARHGAASANIDRAGKATSARSCSLLRANGKEPPLGEQRCPGRSVPAQGGTHAGVRPGEAIPAHPGACHGSVICPTQPCSCPWIGTRGWTPGSSRKGEDALCEGQGPATPTATPRALGSLPPAKPWSCQELSSSRDQTGSAQP